MCSPAVVPTNIPTAPASAGTPIRLTETRRLPGRSLIPASMAAMAATTPREVRSARTATRRMGPADSAPRTTAFQGIGPR